MAPALACVRPVLLSRRAPEQRARTAAQRAQKLTHGASRAAAPFALAAKRAPARRVAPHAGGTVCAAVAAASADDNAKEAQAWIDNWRASRAGAGGASVADRVKAFFGGAKLDRNKLAALGTSALLAYGFVSNVNAITLVIISWVSFTKSTGLSPLAAGQWKAYLLTYAALYAVVGNGLRPIRFSISVAITPVFDRFVAFLQKRFSVAKPVAFGMCVFLVNVCGTCTYAALGLRIVTAVLGLPFLA